jgi:ubiquinone/menaquinone biosynthesis C-methylase UbiE
LIDYDQLALDYARHRQVHPGVLRRLIAESGTDGRSSVLEVGCGTGNYILAVQSALGCSGWGIDPSTEMLAEAMARSRSVSFRVGRAERLTFPAEFFDLVFSVDTIHHLDDSGAYLREARRVLRQGGWVCTVTDSEWIIRHRQPLAEYFPETVEVDLGRYPALDEARAAMEVAGFQGILEQMAEFPYMLEEAQAYRDRAFSSLHLIPEQAFRRGLARLEADLQRGAIPCVSRYVLLWGTNPAPTRDA